jgi:hypothetical protein
MRTEMSKTDVSLFKDLKKTIELNTKEQKRTSDAIHALVKEQKHTHALVKEVEKLTKKL